MRVRGATIRQPVQRRVLRAQRTQTPHSRARTAALGLHLSRPGSLLNNPVINRLGNLHLSRPVNRPVSHRGSPQRCLRRWFSVRPEGL